MRGHALARTDISQFYCRTKSPRTKAEPQKQPKKTQDKPKRSRKPVKMSTDAVRMQRQQQAPKTELDYEIERLKAELQQERQMKLVMSYCYA